MLKLIGMAYLIVAITLVIALLVAAPVVFGWRAWQRRKARQSLARHLANR